MSSVATLSVHPSQFPDRVRRDLLESLRTRRVNHKFHYDSVKQTEQWLALHEAFSPSRNDTECLEIYARAFQAAAARVNTRQVHLIGLGCGGGQKDTRLLRWLANAGKAVSYTPCDISTAMVLVAREAALSVVSPQACFPLVCDLATAEDLPEVLAGHGPADAARLITFFGMIPNFEPDLILPKLASLLRKGDGLLFSANLAPGPDYAAGLRQILPQYDNTLTREWLLMPLLDLGVDREDGRLRFSLEPGTRDTALQRVVATFQFTRRRQLAVSGERFVFEPGDSLRLFFSYRYAPTLVAHLLGQQGLPVRERWITRSEEEGVFLCQP